MYQCWSLLILLKKLFNFSKEMGRVCVVQEAQETSWKLVLTESEQIKTGLLWHTAPSFLFYFNMLYCYCWFLMCERLTEKGEFGFWSALENRILEKPCNLEGKQPPRLAAHWQIPVLLLGFPKCRWNGICKDPENQNWNAHFSLLNGA